MRGEREVEGVNFNTSMNTKHATLLIIQYPDPLPFCLTTKSSSLSLSFSIFSSVYSNRKGWCCITKVPSSPTTLHFCISCSFLTEMKIFCLPGFILNLFHSCFHKVSQHRINELYCLLFDHLYNTLGTQSNGMYK